MKVSILMLFIGCFISLPFLAQQDVGVSTLLSPQSGCQVGTSNHLINAIVRNYSSSIIGPNNITVKYQINGGPIVSQLIGTFLSGNASYNFTFTQTHDFSTCGSYTVKIWAVRAGDPNHLNDTLNYLFQNDCNPIPGIITGPSYVCSGNQIDELELNSATYYHGLEWYSQTYPSVYNSSGNHTPNFPIINLTDSTNFYILFPGGYCPDTVTPIFGIGISPGLNPGTVSPNLNFCNNNVLGNVSVTGYTSTIADWEQSDDGGLSWSSLGNNSTFIDISYLTSSAKLRALIESGACGTGYSSQISVNVDQEIIPGTISGASTVCQGANSDTLVLSGNQYDFGFEWYSSTDNVTFSPTGNTNDTFVTNNILQTTYYKVVLNGNFCANAETVVVSVVVDSALNVGTTSPDLNLCANAVSGTISLSAFSTSIVDWEQSNNGGVSWSALGSNAATQDISFLTASAIFRANVQSGTCGSDYSDTIFVTIENAILPGAISGASTVCQGANSDTLVLSGNQYDFGFEWYSSTDNLTFSPTGNTNDTFVTNNILQTIYYKVVLNGNFCANAETAVVSVVVDSALNVGTTSADLNLCANAVSGTISLSAFSTSIVDWEQSNNGGVSWSALGSNAATQDISFLTASAIFRANVQSGTCGSDYSDTIFVTIENAILPGAISGASTVCQGANSDTLVLSGNQYDFGFEWYSSTDNLTFSPTGNTNDTFVTNNILQTTYYKVVLNGNFCADAETAVVSVVVDSALNVGTTSADLNLCANAVSGTISLSAFSTSIVDWEQSNNGGVSWSALGSNAATQDISFLTASAIFRANVQSGTCGADYSDTIFVTIENAILPGAISGASTVCQGANSDTLVLSGNQYDFGFEWYSSTDNLTFSPTGNTNDTFVTNNILQTTYYKVVLNGNFCANAETAVVSVVVDSALNVGTTSADLNLCANAVSGTISLSAFSTSIVDWEQSNNGGVSWSALGSNAATQDISFLTASAIFRANVQSGTCGADYSDTIFVTIDNLGIPATIGNPFQFCENEPFTDSLFVVNHDGNIYDWQFSVNNGATWLNLGTADSIIYPSSISQSALFQMVTSHGSCPNVESNSIMVTVLPIPIVSAGDDDTVKIGESTQLSGTGGLFGIWVPGDFLSDSTSANPISTPTNSTQYIYMVIANNGCTNSDSVNLFVYFPPIILPEEFKIYNIVTPNGDGKNDYFHISGLNTIEDYKIKIFNANGNLIFSSTNYENDWGATYNGKVIEDGTYLYTFEIDGITKHRGFLTIIRGNEE